MLSRRLTRVREAIDKEVREHGLPRRPEQGWIAAVRMALGMSQVQLASRFLMTRQSLHEMEDREIAGSISLNQLREAADKLGCDLVYAFVPRKPLNEFVEERAREVAARALAPVARSMQIEDQEVEFVQAVLDDYVAEHLTERDLWNPTEHDVKKVLKHGQAT